jgi:hypothetical protein
MQSGGSASTQGKGKSNFFHHEVACHGWRRVLSNFKGAFHRRSPPVDDASAD